MNFKDFSKDTKDKSSRILEYVFEKCDIFLVKNFKPEYFFTNKNSKYRHFFNHTRWEYLFKENGIISNLNSFNSEMSRFFEYITVLDNPSSLRQKYNIISSLLDCDFNTNTPLHVSLKPVNFTKKKFNIESLPKNKGKFLIECHPGHTRKMGSTFLNCPLSNVLLYIHKSYE